MKMQALHRRNASTLIISLVVIACIGVSIAASFQSLLPKYRGTHQGIVWQEVLHGADAGADLAIDTLNTWTKSNQNPDTFPWTSNSWTITDSTNYSTNGERTLASASLPVIGGPNNVRLTKLAVDIYTREGIPMSLNAPSVFWSKTPVPLQKIIRLNYFSQIVNQSNCNEKRCFICPPFRRYGGNCPIHFARQYMENLVENHLQKRIR